MALLSKPYTFSANTTISSSEVNANFDTLYNGFNGNISDANLATGAVTTAKIADANITTAKLATGAVTPEKWTNPYKFSATASGSTTLGTSYTKILLANEEFDTNSNFASSTYTAPVDGFYCFTGSFMVTPGGSGERFGVGLFKNGSQFKRVENIHASSTAVVGCTVTALIQLSASDTIELYGISNTGGRGTIASTNTTYMSGYLVSLT